MANYRLIKKYPSLPSDWEVGMEVKKHNETHNYFSPCNDKYKNFHIHYGEVIHNPEFWEEIVEIKEVIEYPVGTKVKNLETNTEIHKREDGWYKEDKTAFTDEMIKKGEGKRFQIIEEPKNNNPYNLEIGKTYTVKYKYGSNNPTQKVTITKFTDLGHPWGEFEKGSGGIITDCWEIIEEPKKEYPLEYSDLVDGEYYTTKFEGQGLYTFRQGHTLWVRHEIGEIATYKGNFNPENGFHNFRLASKSEIEMLEPKKEFEILSFTLNGFLFKQVDNDLYWSTKGTFARFIEMLKDNKIHSIRRISDGEIFTIGDKVVTPDGLPFTISRLYFDSEGKKLLCNGEKTGNGHISINKIKKVKVLFTTKDGVEIFEHGPISAVNTSYWNVEKIHSNSPYYYDNKTKLVIFYHKENAEEYVLMNKPLNISIKELCSIVGNCDGTAHVDLDKLTKKLKTLGK